MIKENILNELREESKATRKILEHIPDESLTWKPHEKSMSVERLASHIAEITGWVGLIMDSDGIDFAKFDYAPPKIKVNSDLIKFLREVSKKP